MIDGNNEIYHIEDGRFSLDPGAAFGIVPRPVWSRKAEENENGRIDMTANILVIKNEKWVGLFDSGLSSAYDEKMKAMFEIRPSETFWDELKNILGDRSIDFFFETHLHFDHIGRALEYLKSGKQANIVAQRDEINDWRRPNDLSKNSYPPFLRKRNAMTALDGNKRINSHISVIKTGGHTRGHQALIYSGKKEIIYFGDIVPSSFHIRPPYITAIDHFPLDTLEMKKKLIRKAIRDNAVVVFNHDIVTPFATLSGDPDRPTVEPVVLDSE